MAFCDFLNAKGGGLGGFAPYKLFFQVSASGKYEKIEPVSEHRQCLLFFKGAALALLPFRKNAEFF